MANISVTGRCNRACSYCFAGAALALQSDMTMGIFERTLELLQRSSVKEVRLLGGEPTLHPRFTEILDRVLATDLHLVVFSGGNIPDPVLSLLLAFPEDRLQVLTNATTLLDPVDPSNANLLKTLALLGRRVMLGANIQRRHLPLQLLLNIIAEYNLTPRLRLGLAHPTLDGDNLSLRPKHYASVGRDISGLACAAAARGVTLTFDCGFVPCMFESEELPALEVPISQLGRRCNPLPDILPDGSAVACFPLWTLGAIHTGEFQDIQAIQKQQRARVAPYSALGVFPDCVTCTQLKEGNCVGGCRAHAIGRLLPDHAGMPLGRDVRKTPTVRATDLLHAGNQVTHLVRAKWSIPYIDQPLEFWESLSDEFAASINEVYFPIPGNFVGSGRPTQPSRYLEDFLAWRGISAAVLVNPIVLRRPLEEVTRHILSVLTRLQNDYGIHAATLANIELAREVRASLPDFILTASVMLDVSTPLQVAMVEGAFDVLVPSGRIMRDLPALRMLRQAFRGRIRLMVNEGCLPGCPLRIQHFFEMQSGLASPDSLCNRILQSSPWMRLTGAWVLPQHLGMFDGLLDEYKLVGRVTLRDADTYRRVLRAYINRTPLAPHEIGGGPASVLAPMTIDESFYRRTLNCQRECHACSLCRDYFAMPQTTT